ncbi:frizzled-9-like protein [Leptotrombidium deliense]|uniref:Frizzled-9-like protein n=1 Tax=Leptotrombidium deliense TaxID=299467 RepID=A0A443SRN9_9ACAR|nr:frizzled-9-like protein [Leptotrombidium deliense]
MIVSPANCLLFIFSFFIVCNAVDSRHKSGNRCERITIPMCQDMPYNTTRMPNILGHTDQSEAAIKLHEFILLIEIDCSRHLKFFLCSLYAPMCSEQVDISIPSCQSICEEVKSRCLPVLEQINFAWPSMLNCSQLPSPEKNGLCMQFPPHLRDEKRNLNKSDNILDNWQQTDLDLDHFSRKTFVNTDSTTNVEKSRKSADTAELQTENSIEKTMCPLNFVTLPVSKQLKNSSERCVQKCGEDVLFTHKDKVFLQNWIAIFAWICFISTFFTFATLWIDAYRFRYPEKAIAFLSICHCLLSIAYLIRIHAGSQFVSCDRTATGKLYLTVEGVENSGCIIVFLLLYYFGMAATFWWLMLTVHWYLAAVMHWTADKLESNASYLHVSAWTIPALFTIIVLALRHVNGDELTGLCFIGYREQNAMLIFVIVPLSVIAFIVAFILLSAFISQFCCHSSTLLKHTKNQLYKRSSNRLHSRMAIFSLVYLLSLICIISCYVYEYVNWNKWKSIAAKRAFDCQTTNLDTHCRLTDSIPRKEIFALKIFLSLFLGIFSGIWTCNADTWTSWCRFYSSTFSRRRRRDFKNVSCLSLRNSSFIHGPSSRSVQQMSASSSVPHINRMSAQYASIKSHRTRRSYHKQLNELTQL